jgi:hypothetical protein
MSILIEISKTIEFFRDSDDCIARLISWMRTDRALNISPLKDRGRTVRMAGHDLVVMHFLQNNVPPRARQMRREFII